MDVVEDCAAAEVVPGPQPDLLAHGLEQRMARRHPLDGRIVGEKLFVEDHLLVFAPEAAEAWLQAFAGRPQRARHPADPVNMAAFGDLLRLDPRQRAGLEEEVLDDLGHQPPLLGLGRLADNGRQVQLAAGQPFEGGIGDAPEALGIHFFHDAVQDHLLGQVAGVHVAQHALQLVGRENVAQRR